VEAIAREDGLDIALDSFLPDHASAITRLAEARFIVGAGISDGSTITLLEAMAVGTFCILSDTACACEWITPGETGFVISPHDVAALGDAIVRAATDNALVDGAVAVNRATIEKRWSSDRVKPVVIRGYRDVITGMDPRHG
jgi:glycosyltransferase involved in cell wall biosynthesis